jgi:hypothetical protein
MAALDLSNRLADAARFGPLAMHRSKNFPTSRAAVAVFSGHA